MDRDDVRAEGVENNHVVISVQRFLQSKPGIAENHLGLSRFAILQEREVMSRDVLDRRVDFVKRPELFRLRVTSQRSRPQTDNANPSGRMARIKKSKGLADGSAAVKIGERLMSSSGIETLPAVDR